ncbi:HIRA-interacting protein 3-like [Capsicum annuum]|uniref:HIRA-interacting protein 3-like n=1 Tax=Capsicum annuum TaxID=4072 RepID=UPI001FB0B433|nr:HIRA-interacting protein 3-like [Capsicum annuum]
MTTSVTSRHNCDKLSRMPSARSDLRNSLPTIDDELDGLSQLLKAPSGILYFNTSLLVMYGTLKWHQKRKSPTEPKKTAKDDVHRKLLNEESDYEEEEPLFRRERSEKGESKQHESELAKADEENQEESKESESEGIAFGSPSTEQQDDEEFPPRRTLIKYLENRFDAWAKEMTGSDLAIFRAALDKVKAETPQRKKKKKGEKKGKNKRDEPDSEEKRKAKKKAKKKVEKEELKKERLQSMADNEKWEAANRARAVGALSCQALTTARLDDPDGEKITDDTVAGSKTQDPRA